MNDKYIQAIFKDITVIELSSVLAGPSVGMFLAELGARVIKVEPKGRGDITRKWKLKSEDPKSDTSAYYHSVNIGKEIVFLDLKDQKDYDKLLEMLPGADILTANFKSSSAEAMKLDYKSLSKHKEDLIYCQLYGYSKENERLAYDVIMQAEAGFLSMSGISENALCKMPVALIDIIAGHQMKEAILLAMLKKMKSGKGSFIECSLLESGIVSLANQASNFLNAGEIAKPMGMLHPNIAPYGEMFMLSDGNRIVLAIGDDAQFNRLWKRLEIDVSLENFSSNHLRLQNREDLYELLKTVFLTMRIEDIKERFNKDKIPFGHIKNVQAVMQDAENLGLIIQSSQKSQNVKALSSIAFTIR